jgi:hypothetical protein
MTIPILRRHQFQESRSGNSSSQNTLPPSHDLGIGGGRSLKAMLFIRDGIGTKVGLYSYYETFE